MLPAQLNAPLAREDPTTVLPVSKDQSESTVLAQLPAEKISSASQESVLTALPAATAANSLPKTVSNALQAT